MPGNAPPAAPGVMRHSCQGSTATVVGLGGKDHSRPPSAQLLPGPRGSILQRGNAPTLGPQPFPNHCYSLPTTCVPSDGCQRCGDSASVRGSPPLSRRPQTRLSPGADSGSHQRPEVTPKVTWPTCSCPCPSPGGSGSLSPASPGCPPVDLLSDVPGASSPYTPTCAPALTDALLCRPPGPSLDLATCTSRLTGGSQLRGGPFRRGLNRPL